MSIFKIFMTGFRTANKKAKMLVYLWGINLLFSSLAVTPLYFLISKEFSRSFTGEQIGRGLNMTWLGDFIYKYKDFYPAFIGWILVFIIIIFLLSIYLNGGIIGRIVSEDERITFADFLSDCGKYFPRFFRVALLTLVGYFIVFGLLFYAVSQLFKVWARNASTEWPLIISSNIKFIIALLLFTIVRMFFDYVKIRLVVEDSRKSIRATLLNIPFIMHNFFKVWALFLCVGLIVCVVSVIFILVNSFLPTVGALLIVCLLWGQFYMFIKIWTKLLFFSTEYHFLSLCGLR